MRSIIPVLEAGIPAGFPPEFRKVIPGLLLLAGTAAVAMGAGNDGGSKNGASTPTASGDTVKMVEYFLKAPTADLPAEKVPDFLSVDPATLPAKLRPGWAAKRQELLTLKKFIDAKKKPLVRRLDSPPAVCVPMQGDARLLSALKDVSGFEEITDEELAFVMEKTKCTDCELQEEFSLIVFLLDRGPKKRPQTILLLHQNDPLMVLVAKYRAGSRSGLRGTEFFNIGLGAVCR